MKNTLLFSFAIFFLAAAINAQEVNFSGKWVLDVSQSKPEERSNIESMTVTIEHNGESFARNTDRKDKQAPEGRRGMGGRGGAFAIGVGREEYRLDGKEKTSSMETPMGSIPVSTVAKRNQDGSVTISTTRTFNGPMGETVVVIVETLSLSADGSTMKMTVDNRGPRPSVSERIFKKS